MALEPGFDQVLRFGQNHVVRGALVCRFAYHDAVLRHETRHIVDVSVGVVAVQTVGEHQHVAEPEGLAKRLDNLPDFLRVITVLARQAIQRSNAEAVTIDFDSATFKNVRDAYALLVFKNVGDSSRNFVVIFPRRKFCAPGVKDRFRNNRFFSLLQEERTVIANPDVVCLDGKETSRVRAVGNGNFFFRRQKVLFRNQHIHGLEFANRANQIDIEFADHFSAFTVPVLFIVWECEPRGGLFFPFGGVTYICFSHIYYLP